MMCKWLCARFKAGASEFLEKPFNEQQLLDSIHIAIEQDAEQRGKALKLAEIQRSFGFINRSRKRSDGVNCHWHAQ